MSLLDEGPIEPGAVASLEEIGKSLLINAGGEQPTPPQSDDEPDDQDPAGDAQAADDLDDEQGTDTPLEDGEEDEEPDLEAEADDEEAEEQFDEIELDDDTLITVKADGEEIEVTLAELRRDFSGQKAINNRLEQAANQLKDADQKQQLLNQKAHELAGKLQVVDQILAQQNQEPDWDALYQEDPTEWAHQRELFRQQQEQRQAINAEITQLQAQAEEEQKRVMDEYKRGEVEKLRDAIPEFKDRDKGPALHRELVSFAVNEYGFTEQEIAAVADSRPFRMLYDIYMARQGQVKTAAQTQKRRRVKPKVVPGAGTRAPGQKTMAKKRQDRLRKRAKESGHPDDVAKTMIVS